MAQNVKAVDPGLTAAMMTSCEYPAAAEQQDHVPRMMPSHMLCLDVMQSFMASVTLEV